jgi:hypothetical protein
MAAWAAWAAWAAARAYPLPVLLAQADRPVPVDHPVPADLQDHRADPLAPRTAAVAPAAWAAAWVKIPRLQAQADLPDPAALAVLRQADLRAFRQPASQAAALPTTRLAVAEGTNTETAAPAAWAAAWVKIPQLPAQADLLDPAALAVLHQADLRAFRQPASPAAPPLTTRRCLTPAPAAARRAAAGISTARAVGWDRVADWARSLASLVVQGRGVEAQGTSGMFSIDVTQYPLMPCSSLLSGLLGGAGKGGSGSAPPS